MKTFHLQIVTPDGLMFDDETEKVIVRTIEGDVGILAGHANYVSPLAAGTARVTLKNGDTKAAVCEGGLLSVKKDVTRIAADTFAWKEGK